MKETLLSVENLSINVLNGKGNQQRLVKNISFKLGYEKLGIVGASGSGKSLCLRSLIGLIQAPLQLKATHLHFDQTNLLTLNENGWVNVRGRKIAMIMQDAKFCLNPRHTVLNQLTESYRLFKDFTKTEIYTKSFDLLETLKIPDGAKILKAYPHELSGGTAQRLMIGMMLIGEPKLLLADEPTSAIDATIRKDIISLLQASFEARRMGIIFVSHDIHLVTSFCDRVIVMNEGQIVEICNVDALSKSEHSYTQTLLENTPKLVAKY